MTTILIVGLCILCMYFARESVKAKKLLRDYDIPRDEFYD